MHINTGRDVDRIGCDSPLEWRKDQASFQEYDDHVSWLPPLTVDIPVTWLPRRCKLNKFPSPPIMSYLIPYLQLILAFPCSSIDSCKHRTFLISSPVSTSLKYRHSTLYNLLQEMGGGSTTSLPDVPDFLA
jgi:hypothetical protein